MSHGIRCMSLGQASYSYMCLCMRLPASHFSLPFVCYLSASIINTSGYTTYHCVHLHDTCHTFPLASGCSSKTVTKLYENEVSERRVCGPERLRHLCSLLFVKRNRFLGADGRWWLCLLIWVWDGCGDTLKEGFKMLSEDFIQWDIEVEGCYWEKSRNVVRRQDCARRSFFNVFLTAAVFPLWLLVSLDENFLLCLVFSGFAFLKKCSILWNLLLANFLPSQRVSAHSRWQYHSLDYPCHVVGQTRAYMGDVNLSVCYAIPRHVTQMYCL